MLPSLFRLSLLVSLVGLVGARAQIAPPAFDVASIKPNKAGGMGTRIMFQPGGRFTADNITLKFLIRMAYNVQDFQISGGPSWMNSDKWDVEAKGGDAPAGDMRSMTEEQRQADMERRRQMIQTLLADRFKLTVHKESKEAPIYALVVAKSGLKIKELPPEEVRPEMKDMPEKPDPKSPMRGRMRMERGQVSGEGVKLAFLTNSLADQVGRKIVDQTGLKGDYTFELKWTPDESHEQGFKGPGDAPSDAGGPSIFTALQEQLGLKLESQKGPVDLVVIDGAEKATEN